MKKIFVSVAMATVVAATSLFAYDGLNIKVLNGSDMGISFPSKPGQTFAILFTTNLSLRLSQWQLLAGSLPAAGTGTNTVFIHPGQITLQTASSGSAMALASITKSTVATLLNSGPLVLQANQTTVPLAIFPPNLSLPAGCQIIPSPASSAEASIQSAGSMTPLSGGPSLPAPKPLDFETGDPQPVKSGFYQVFGCQILGGLTNGMTVSDYVTVTAKAEGNAKYLRLLVDGRPIPAQSALYPPFTNTLTFADVDTTRLTNGTHTFQVEAYYDINLDEGRRARCLSQPFQVTTVNELTYPDWDDLTEDEVANFDIVSAHPSVDWEIDIYNVYDYINYIYGFTDQIIPLHCAVGTTTNGIIQYDWNFMDDWGNRHNDPNNDPQFISFTYTWWPSIGWSSAAKPKDNGPAPKDVSGSASAMNPPQKQPDKWPATGLWVVAWQDMFHHFYDTNSYYQNSMTTMLNMAGTVGGGVFYQLPTGGTNAQTFPLRYHYESYARLNPTNVDFDRWVTNDNRLLVRMLQDGRARNFFYTGHGEANHLATAITPDMIRTNSTMHRYRFVWLDGCETGMGSWPEAFGIKGPGIFAVNYYQERTKRPALFVGNQYSTPIGVVRLGYNVGGLPYRGYIPRCCGEFYRQFVFYWWTMNWTYTYAVENAQKDVKGAYPDGKFIYDEETEEQYNPKDGQEYFPGDDQIRIGYDDMRFNEYNTAGDIPRPQ